jgi:zinc transporter, ZIP family
MSDNVIAAFVLTTIAGLSTGIGSAIAFFSTRTNYRFLSLSLGFSAGVMIYVSFAEMMPEASSLLAGTFTPRIAETIRIVCFLGGMGVSLFIDRLVPEEENPHEARSVEEYSQDDPAKRHKLMRLGLFSALAITIHNFPEGIATFAATLSDVSLGGTIAAAVAIHNIPEGIAVSVPIYFATGSRVRAFRLSLLSGLAEPLGAVMAYLVLRPFLNEAVLGGLFAAVAGIMIFISLDELLPTAREYGAGHHAVYGVIGGMALMAFGLMFL